MNSTQLGAKRLRRQRQTKSTMVANAAVTRQPLATMLWLSLIPFFYCPLRGEQGRGGLGGGERCCIHGIGRIVGGLSSLAPTATYDTDSWVQTDWCVRWLYWLILASLKWPDGNRLKLPSSMCWVVLVNHCRCSFPRSVLGILTLRILRSASWWISTSLFLCCF